MQVDSATVHYLQWNNLGSKLLKFVKSIAREDLSFNVVEERSEYTPERSYGNFDDCFDDGMACQEAHNAIAAREVLISIEDGIKRSENKIFIKDKVSKL